MTSPIHQYSGQPNRPRIDPGNAGVLTRRHARKVIAASTRIGRTALSTVSGHSIYHAERPKADGGGSEVAEFEIPWVCDTFEAESAIVGVLVPRGITLTPYLAQAVVEPEPNDNYRGVRGRISGPSLSNVEQERRRWEIEYFLPARPGAYRASVVDASIGETPAITWSGQRDRRRKPLRCAVSA